LQNKVLSDIAQEHKLCYDRLENPLCSHSRQPKINCSFACIQIL
jgi:hypothetical protein